MKLLKFKFITHFGMSMISTLVGVGLMAGIATMMMRLSENMTAVKAISVGVADESNLDNLVMKVISDERFCRVSLIGSSSLRPSFYKTDIDGSPANIGEGYSMDLYLSNQAGTSRGKLVLTATPSPAGTNPEDDPNKVGKLTIKSIKLVMDNNRTTPEDYLASSPNYHYDIGTLRIIAQKKDSKNPKDLSKARDIVKEYEIYTKIRTSATRRSNFASCEGAPRNGREFLGGCPTANRWYCDCGTASGGIRRIRFLQCFHCNQDRVIDRIHQDEVEFSNTSLPCPSSVDLPPSLNHPVIRRW